MNKIFRVFLILYATIFCLSANNAEAKLNLFEKPRYIPEVNFYDDNGTEQKLQSNKDALLIAVLWSRHCGPCLDEMESLQKFTDKVSKQGIRVIMISPKEDWESAKERDKFLKKLGLTNVKNYMDPKSNFSHGMGVLVTPTSILVNNKGEEVGQITGAVKWDNEEVIDYLLKLKDKSKNSK